MSDVYDDSFHRREDKTGDSPPMKASNVISQYVASRKVFIQVSDEIVHRVMNNTNYIIADILGEFQDEVNDAVRKII